MDASRGNHTDVIKFLLDTWGADLQAEDTLGRHALHHAAQAGAGDAIDYLIGMGADVNMRSRENWVTPLHYAAKVWSLLLQYFS